MGFFEDTEDLHEPIDPRRMVVMKEKGSKVYRSMWDANARYDVLVKMDPACYVVEVTRHDEPEFSDDGKIIFTFDYAADRDDRLWFVQQFHDEDLFAVARGRGMIPANRENPRMKCLSKYNSSRAPTAKLNQLLAFVNGASQGLESVVFRAGGNFVHVLPYFILRGDLPTTSFGRKCKVDIKAPLIARDLYVVQRIFESMILEGTANRSIVFSYATAETATHYDRAQLNHVTETFKELSVRRHM